ncbi:hypothetical protein CBM2615_A20007 [Cupriavidus taiwanensis]|uniref:Uncharacterized protein n=1 Tax=Cupriavidus taiwanensis TaxID=164546 RepID=A0A375E116_9BURK|nr:hypothetical protein CBM2615_A20007 [Cupriavidus taiwanensis]SOZ54963.1 hypothetical protein CBM2613_A20007 [Cupriavidus taiwanensis]SPA05338.1 hypothetical protein CBM2625_A20007 [Cupriavidus taiwanensis]
MTRRYKLRAPSGGRGQSWGEHAKLAREAEDIRDTYRAKHNFIKLLDTLS